MEVVRTRQANRLAIAGGAPVRADSLQAWPPPAAPALNDAVIGLLQRHAGGRGPRPTGDDEKRAFEEAFARYCGTPFAVGVNSGTSAIDLAVQALQLAEGGVVVGANYGHPSTIRAAAKRHALRLLDIDANSLCLSASDLVDSLRSTDVRCVLLTHIAGTLAGVESIQALCRQAGVPLIEDASHAHGARAGDRVAGTFGAVGCFSLHATKNLAVGEGGIITCTDVEVHRRIRREHDIGRDPNSAPYDFVCLGGNYRLSEIASLIGRFRLDDLDEQNARRMRNVAALRRMLPPDSPLDLLPGPRGTDVHAYHIVAARYRPEMCAGIKRHRFILALCAEGILCSGGWTAPLSVIASTHARVEPHATPATDRALRDLVWLDQRLFLTDDGPRQAAEAVAKIQRLAPSMSAR